MKNRKILFMTQGALIAALYVAFSFIAYSFGLSGNAVVQMRLSEMLTVLPAFMPAAIPGLAIGCLLTNLLTGCAVWDVIFGTLATLLGAIGTFLLRKKQVACAPPADTCKHDDPSACSGNGLWRSDNSRVYSHGRTGRDSLLRNSGRDSCVLYEKISK